MRIKEGFMLREVCDDYMVVPVGAASIDFKSVIRLNETGAFVWKLLQDGKSEEEIIEEITSSYNIDEKTAKDDVDRFIWCLKKAGITDE